MANLNKFPTHQPALEELANLFNEKLKTYFETVECSVVECPDLRQSPFNLVGRGLSSESPNTNKILDVGGEKFLVPLPKLEKPAYEMVQICKESGLAKRGHLVGAGNFI